MNDLEAPIIGNVSLSVAYILEPVSLPDNIVTEKPCKGSLNKCMYACMYVCNMGYTVTAMWFIQPYIKYELNASAIMKAMSV